MVINTNMAAINSATNLDNSTNALNSALAQLSSGSKLVNPSDNPAGLAESIELNAQIGQTQAENSNVSNAISFSQTQDGYLQQVGSALDQMSTLAVEAQDPTKSSSEISDYQSEFAALGTFITQTAGAQFNGVSLFGASLSVSTAFGMSSVNLGASAYTTATASDLTTYLPGGSASMLIAALPRPF